MIGGYALYAVQLTDPLVVPPGTRQLNLTYSDLELHLQSPSQWIRTNASATVDLVQLVNLSRTIALVNIPNGSVVDTVKFDISSVQARVNGTVYSVTTPTNIIDVPIVGATEVRNLGAALLDLSPRVLEIASGTSAYLFMVPSATAVVRSGATVTQSSIQPGSESIVTSDDKNKLASAVGAAEVVSNRLSASGNATTLSFTLKNTGNVTLYLLAVEGRGNFTSMIQSTCATLTDSGDGKHTTTTTSCAEGGPEHPNEVMMAVNGTTLLQVKGENHAATVGPTVISPGQSVTISFSGILTTGSNNIPFTPASGLTYTFHLDFSNDVHVSFNVTAA
ncbi:MAG: hypothetical protein JRN06_08620 [Nitrososphaerota archaeon]|nr:hypothetical protein [Nitrososphaerota archaeon]MDG7024625.1 hypothetical protein [Nitrososphaerota archaeon]